jgi:ketosteroid isomerase-like protein
VLSDYAPDAVLYTSQGPLRGVEQIKTLFQTLIAEFKKPGARFDLQHQTIDGEFGFIVWTGQTADNDYELGTDTFLVKGGKIVAQSFAGKVAPKR